MNFGNNKARFKSVFQASRGRKNAPGCVVFDYRFGLVFLHGLAAS